MYFKLLNFICFSFFNFCCLASILFKWFVVAPVYFVFLVFNFFNFYILNIFFFVFIFQIYIYLGFFIVFFLGIYVFIVSFQRFVFRFGFENSTYFSEYSENFFSANFFSEPLFTSFCVGAQFENRVYSFNFFFKTLKKLIKFPCKKDKNFFVYVLDKPNTFFGQFDKVAQAKRRNFLSRFYLQERFDYIRTPEETRYELLERYQGRFLPPYTDVQYRRVFRDSYREYLDKFYRPKINYYNKFSFNQTSSLGLNSYFDSTFMTNFFLPREFFNFVFLQIEKYFLSEFFVFFNFFVFENKFFILFFSAFFGNISNKVFLSYLLVLVYIMLFLFFLGKHCFQFFKSFYIFVYSFFRIRLLVFGFFSVFNFFYYTVYFFRVFGSFVFLRNIFNRFEFFRFKKFSQSFSEYFNFKTLHLFKGFSYSAGSKVYSQDFPFSLSVYNPLRFTYPGFESWDCVDYMLSPVEFNLYYSNQPFNFQHLPAVSMYRPRPGISKLKNKLNHFFVNEFSFPFTYFEENFIKVGSFVNTYVFFFAFFVTFLPFLCIEIIRFLLIQIIFFFVYFFNNTVYFFYNRISVRLFFIFSLFSKIVYQVFKICLFLFLIVQFFLVLLCKVGFRFISFYKVFDLSNSKVSIFNFFKRSSNWFVKYGYFFLKFLWLSFYILRNKLNFLLFICLLAFLSVKFYFKLTIVQLYVVFYFCWQTFFKVFFAEILNKFSDGSFVKYIGINFYPSVIFFVIISSTLFWCYIFKSVYFFKRVVYFNLFSYLCNFSLIFFRKFIQFMFGKASLVKYCRTLLFWQPAFSFEHKHYNDEYDEEDDYEEEDDEHWDPDEDSELVYSEETLTSDEFILDYGFDLDEELFVLDFDGIIPYMENIVTRPPLWGRFKFPPFNFFPFKQLNYYFPYRMKLGEYEALYINNVDIHDIQPRKDGKDALIDEHDFPFSLEFVPMFKLFNSASRLGKFSLGIPKFPLPPFNFSGYYKFREFDSIFYNFFSSVDVVYNLPYLRSFFKFRFLTSEFEKRFLSSSFMISYSFMPVLTCSDALTNFLIFQTSIKFFPSLILNVNDTIGFSKKLYLSYFNFFNFSISESEFGVFTAKYFFNYTIDLYKSRFNTIFEIMLFNQGNVYSKIYPSKQLFFSSISDPVIDLSFTTSHAIVIFYLLIAEEPFSENAGFIPRRFIYNLSIPFENGTFNMIKIRRLYRFYEEEDEEEEFNEEEFNEEEFNEDEDEEEEFNEHLYIDSNLSSMILTHPQDIPPVSQWPWKEIFWVFFEFIKEQLD